MTTGTALNVLGTRAEVRWIGFPLASRIRLANAGDALCVRARTIGAALQ